MRPFLSLLVLAVFVCGNLLEAQGLHIVPTIWSNQDAPGGFVVPGIGTSSRMQLVVASDRLITLQGRNITGLAFRRDSDDQVALAAAQGAVIVRMGMAAHEPIDVQADFGSNLPAPVEVYRGPILAPASPANPANGQWSSPNIVEIVFTTQFSYVGGPLCIEIESTAAAGVWWPIDAVEDGVAGVVSSQGHACGPHAWLGETAWADASSLVVSRTAVFGLIGQPFAPCSMLVGFGTLPQPVDLGIVGFRGCELRVDAFASIAGTLSDAIRPPEIGGGVNVRLHLPNSTGLFGATLAVQWVEFGSVFASSNTLLCSVAGSAPQVGIAVISSRVGESPTVQSAVTPVVGFRHD